MEGPARFLACGKEPLLQKERFPFLAAETLRLAAPDKGKEKRIMRCRNMLLGATALALGAVMAAAPAFAQTQTMPAQQSAVQSPADQAPSAVDSDPSAAGQDAATSARHQRHHHMRTTPTDSPSERRMTNDLNKRQLAQAEAADQQVQQTAQGQSPSGPAGSPADGDQANGGQDDNQRAAMNAPSTEVSAATPDQTDIGPRSEPDRTADSAAPSGMNASAGAHQADGASTARQTGPTPVTGVQNAQQTLAAANVQGSGGKMIGTVQAITNDPNGTPRKVQVELDQSLGMGKRSVWINADQLTYQPQDNAVTTTLSPDQLSTM
jgi:hypothetical protein